MNCIHVLPDGFHKLNWRKNEKTLGSPCSSTQCCAPQGCWNSFPGSSNVLQQASPRTTFFFNKEHSDLTDKRAASWFYMVSGCTRQKTPHHIVKHVCLQEGRTKLQASPGASLCSWLRHLLCHVCPPWKFPLYRGPCITGVLFKNCMYCPKATRSFLHSVF